MLCSYFTPEKNSSNKSLKAENIHGIHVNDEYTAYKPSDL